MKRGRTEAVTASRRVGAKRRPMTGRTRCRVGRRLVEIGGPTKNVEALGKPLDLFGIATEQDRIRHHTVAVAEQHAVLVANGDDRTDQMLIEAHAAGSAVHDHAETLPRHRAYS